MSQRGARGLRRVGLVAHFREVALWVGRGVGPCRVERYDESSQVKTMQLGRGERGFTLRTATWMEGLKLPYEEHLHALLYMNQAQRAASTEGNVGKI